MLLVSPKGLENRRMQLGSGLIGPDFDRPGDDGILCQKLVRYRPPDQENL
jgi:hypothetical protein